MTLEILITKCACPSRNAAEDIVPFPCHAYELNMTHELSVTYSM